MRLALHVVKMSENDVQNFSNALIEAKTKISYHFFTLKPYNGEHNLTELINSKLGK